MSLNFPRLLPQIDALGQAVAEREAELAGRLPAALRALDSATSLAPQAVQDKVARAGDRWRGAIPTDEPIGAHFEASTSAPGLTVIGADGSQVYPDRHASALYFALNIGSIVIRHDSSEAPTADTQPFVHFRDEDLYTQDGGLITAPLVNGLRDAAEMEALARLAAASVGPRLALLDNGLLLWLALQVREQNRHEVDRALREYLAHLDHLKASGAAVAGLIDRPRSADVLALLHLAGLPLESISDEALRLSPFRGLTDRSLFARLLPPGHRSGRFIDASPVNRDFKARHQQVHFFYLNTGPQGMIARVEIPEWVAARTDLLDLVHAGILQECRTTGGYPYALVRAHELAVLSPAERRELDRLVTASLQRRQLQPRLSQKALTKKWLGPRKRHRV